MKILHCANYDLNKYGKNYYSHDFRIHNGLVRNGLYVYPFSYRDEARKNILSSKKFGAKKVNRNLIACVENIRPDLLLLGHTEIIHNDTLTYIKEKYDIPIAMWWVDSFDEDKVTHLYDRFEILDALFATTHPLYIQKRFHIKKNTIFYMPNMSDASIDTLKNFSQNGLKDEIVYIGKIYKEKEQFFQNLQHADIKIQFFHGIFGASYYEVLSQFRFGLNLSKYNDIPLYSSDRVIHLVANGLLTFTPRIPGFEKIFEEDEIVYFDTIDELRDLYRKALVDRKWAAHIAYNGWKKAHSQYNAQKITKWMIDRIFEGIS